jgi:DNA-binding MarR family transcriptional regulator
MPDLTPLGFAFSELVIEVFRVNGLALAAGDRLTGPLGLTSARWQVMGAVGDEPASVAQVARTMGLTRQSVRETVASLVEAGLISYRENPQHRTAKLLVLTAQGQRALRAVERKHAVWANRLGVAFQAAPLKAALAELRRARELLALDGRRPDEWRQR